MDTPYYSTPYYVYPNPKPFSEFADDIVNNKIEKISKFTHMINDYITADNCEEFIKLFKTNTSVESIEFPSNIFNKKCFELLNEVLKINNTIKELNLSNNVIDNECFELLMDGIKFNTSITNINIWYSDDIVNEYTTNIIINMLSINNIIKVIQIPLYFSDFNQCIRFAEFIKNNNTLTKISISRKNGVNLDGIDLIIDALEYNRNITDVGLYSGEISMMLLDKIAIFCERNKFNTKLKSMSLLDWS
jgi:hypothetical protein